MLAELEASQKNTIQTIILAVPTEAATIQKLLEDVAQGRYQVLARYQDLADEGIQADVRESQATLVIVHQSVAHFSVQSLHQMTYARGHSAKIVIAIVSPIGDVFDAVLSSGAVAFQLPTRLEIFQQVDENYTQLLAEAAQRQAAAFEAPPPPPELEKPNLLQSFPGSIRQLMQVITIWSSKGGDGKSLLAMELAFIQASIGRKVLLVDGDMNRSFIAPALGKKILQYSMDCNITVMAALFHSRAIFPRIADYVYTYPTAPGKGESNLDILMGISSPEQSALPCFTDRNGEAGRKFIETLISAAKAEYEFIIFDIGTLIPVPVHTAAISNASTLVVVSSPMIPAIQPTRLGLEQMRSYNILGEKGPVLVLNKWTDNCGLAKDEFSRFLAIPNVATIPAVPLGDMQRIVNSGRFILEAYLADPDKEDSIKPLVNQILALAEQFSPGARAAIERSQPKLVKAAQSHRRGLFGLGLKK